MRRRSRAGLWATFVTLILAACAAEDVPPPMQADLVVASGPISVDATEVGTGEGDSIDLGNQITVGPGGKGFLTIQDLGRFELFKQSVIRLETWDRTEAGAVLDAGHVTFTNDESTTPLTLQTPSSTIKTLEPGTQFTACQPPTGDTCVVVQEGSIELTSAGLSQTYEKGEGTFTEAAFLTNGQPPGSAICVPNQDFNAWFEKARLNEETPPLGQLVGGYRKCGAEPPRQVSVFVPGTMVWTDTGLDVVTGEMLEITAGGGIKHNDMSPSVSPDGDPNLPGHESNLPGVEDLHHAGLIGRIGEDGVAFGVGREFEETLESDGRLYLGINDIGVDNNDGEFVAIVTLTAP